MQAGRHPWFSYFDVQVTPDGLTGVNARALASYAASGLDAEAVLLECRCSASGVEAVFVRVELYPPQRPEADIRRTEELAVVFTGEDRPPALLAVRPDFPDTPHQNMMPENLPRYPCVDDRPWDEAASGWSPYSYLERVRWWLNAAAMGELAGTGQVIDPFFINSGLDLIVPARVLEDTTDDRSFVLVPPAGLQEQDIRCLHLVEARETGRGPPRHCAILLAAPVSMARSVGIPPGNMDSLLRVARDAGLDLLGQLRSWIAERPPCELTARPVILINFPVARPGAEEVRQNVIAFALTCSLGDLGTYLGVLGSYPGQTAAWGALVPAGPVCNRSLGAAPVFPMTVQLAFDASAATALSGLPPGEPSKALLVGAGAMGSHVALALAREGRHSWTVLDADWLRPHNLARHVLGQQQVGHPKAAALGDMLADLTRLPTAHLVCDILRPAGQADALLASAAAADVIIDVSASVAVARRLSDWNEVAARRVSAFLNPAGDSAVMMAEDASRAIPLDALEAHYYRMVLREDGLTSHLSAPPEGYRYAGGCRAVSARISETSVAVLSGLAAAGIGVALSARDAAVRTWTLLPGGEVRTAACTPSALRRETLAGWTVLLDDALAGELQARRRAAFPAETGGVLVGTADMRRRVIALVDALGPPPDSSGDRRMFTRGVEGLQEQLDCVARRTGSMVRYVGEWHTHPNGSRALPSATDLGQLLSLREELRREGLPATMVIAGSDGERAVLLTDARSADVGR